MENNSAFHWKDMVGGLQDTLAHHEVELGSGSCAISIISPQSDQMLSSPCGFAQDAMNINLEKIISNNNF